MPDPTARLTTHAAALRLGVSVRRVQALIHAGRLPAEKIGRDWLLDPAAVDRHEREPPGRRWPERE